MQPSQAHTHTPRRGQFVTMEGAAGSLRRGCLWLQRALSCLLAVQAGPQSSQPSSTCSAWQPHPRPSGLNLLLVQLGIEPLPGPEAPFGRAGPAQPRSPQPPQGPLSAPQAIATVSP